MNSDLEIVGRLELVRFEEFSEEDESVIAKIDTGADSGALHVVFETLETDDSGKEWLVYQPINEEHKIVKTDNFEKLMVKSSNGVEQERHKINTTIIFRGQKYPISLTLTDRSEMTYEVIIGHLFLKGRFLVDVSQENV